MYKCFKNIPIIHNKSLYFFNSFYFGRFNPTRSINTELNKKEKITNEKESKFFDIQNDEYKNNFTKESNKIKKDDNKTNDDNTGDDTESLFKNFAKKSSDKNSKKAKSNDSKDSNMYTKKEFEHIYGIHATEAVLKSNFRTIVDFTTLATYKRTY